MGSYRYKVNPCPGTGTSLLRRCDASASGSTSSPDYVKKTDEKKTEAKNADTKPQKGTETKDSKKKKREKKTKKQKVEDDEGDASDPPEPIVDDDDDENFDGDIDVRLQPRKKPSTGTKTTPRSSKGPKSGNKHHKKRGKRHDYAETGLAGPNPMDAEVRLAIERADQAEAHAHRRLARGKSTFDLLRSQELHCFNH